MSYIIYRRINRTTYVYEGKSYRDAQGRPRNRQRCLGKLDSDGILISSKRKLPAQIKEVKTVTRKFILVCGGTLEKSGRFPRIPEQKESPERPDSSRASEVPSPSVQSPSGHHQRKVRSVPKVPAKPHTTPRSKAGQRKSRQTSFRAWPARKLHASLPEKELSLYRQLCSAVRSACLRVQQPRPPAPSIPQHETSHSRQTHTRLLRVPVPQALRARFRRKGQGIFRPQPFRRVC